ncbi:bifunctional lysylphosphatidylglycerol flippase/synthetase MprF [Fictibacillus sp. Mic-4]|uniref:bifunctional lysylphosphatidylglycerol flippase/synthetase MprF n=1 Tax=Fictibacillus sp. Mic-4 TaxID=3132826 RepID=UPI003CF20C78
MNEMTKRLLKIGKILFPILLITFIFFQGKKELAGLSLKDSIKAIKEIPNGGFLLAVAVGALAVATMFFYDYILVRSLKTEIPVQKIFRVSWIANTFNGILGFGGLIGASLRAMLYREHVDDGKQLLKGIAWMAPAVINGLSILALLSLFNVFPAHVVLDEKVWMWVVFVGVALIVPAYILVSKLKKSDSISPKYTLMYSAVSFVEWLSAGVVLYVILKLTGIDLTFAQTIGVYTVAATAGVISLIPGGFGSFDLMFLIGMQAFDIEKGAVLTALLLYRIAYYFIPFGLGLVFAALEMTGVVMKKMDDNRFLTPAIETTGVIWTLQRQFFIRLGSWSLSALILLSSLWIFMLVSFEVVYLLASGGADFELPVQLIYLDHALTFGCGLILLFLVKEIYRKTKRAYYMAIIALVAASILNLLTLWVLVAIILLIVAGLLYTLRGRFKRRSLPFTSASVFHMIILSIITLCLFVWLTKLLLDLSGYTGSYIGLYSVTFSAFLFACIYITVFVIIFDKAHDQLPGEEADDKKLEAFLAKHGGNVLSHLGFLGDKRFYFSSDGKAMLQFAKVGKRLVVLGDPFGEPSSIPAILKEFTDETDRYGYYCIFYQISGQLMALYHDLGYNFFKLGEEAVISLDSFTISGKKRAGLRATFNRFEREGYTFDVHHPPFSEDFFQELRHVSDAWLGTKKEKGFSLGYFDEDYLSRAPIATLSDQDGKIVAFMNFMPVYQPGQLSVDLMRYYPDSPGGIMDAMLIHLLNWAKENGYKYFNIGMAPLSNVGQAKTAFLYERIAAAIFNKVRYMYSFSGLRNFKSKYSPIWTGKYLAYGKRGSLAATIILVTHLIGKKQK